MTRDNDMRDNDVTRPFDTLGDIRMTPGEQDEVWENIAESMRSEAGQRRRGLSGRTGGGPHRKRSGALGTSAAAVAAMVLVVAGLGYGILHNTLGRGADGRVVPGSNGTANSGFSTARGSTALPNDLSSILITKYTTVHSKRTDVSTYTVTGRQMQTLYQAIKQTVTPSRRLPKNASISCPTYVSSPQYTAIAWTYEIVVHYPDHDSRSFKQTYDGCLFVIDEQSGAAYMPDIKDHTTFDSLPGLTPLTSVKIK